jgi:hypothetical protein
VRNEKIERQQPAYDRMQMPENAKKDRFSRQREESKERNTKLRAARDFTGPFGKRR